MSHSARAITACLCLRAHAAAGRVPAWPVTFCKAVDSAAGGVPGLGTGLGDTK